MIDEALRSLLTLRASVGNRVINSANTNPPDKTLPRVVYSLISNPRDYTDSGRCGLRKATFQIDAFADSQGQANAVIRQITASATRQQAPGLDGYTGTVGDTKVDRIYFGDDRTGQASAATGQNTTVARSTVDVLIDYRDAI